MAAMTATKLRSNLYRVLERVIRTGRPVDVVIKGRTLRIAPMVPSSKWDQLEPHADAVVGDSDDLIHIDWSNEWKPKL